MRSSRGEAHYIRLIDDIEASLDDPAGIEKLASHLEGVPEILRNLDRPLPDGGRILLTIDPTGLVMSQNAVAAKALGLSIGSTIAEAALTPQALPAFLDRLGGGEGPVPLAVATRAGHSLFLLGSQPEAGGTISLAEVRRGIGRHVLNQLADAVSLIPSETEVLAGLMDGKSIDQIAAALSRKEGTARQQVKSIMTKMGVNSQTQLISTAYALSLMFERTQSPSRGVAGAGTRVDIPGATLFDSRHGPLGLHCFGAMDGVPVFLFHGAIFGIAGHGEFRRAAEMLGLCIIAPERPGFGHTQLPDDADPVELACAQALDVLESLGKPRVVVLAHDIGTRFAARLARLAPERVAAVVAASTTPPMQTWAQTAGMPTRHRVNAWAAQKLPGLMDKIVGLGLSQIARQGVDVLPKLVFDGCDFDQAVLRRPDCQAALQEGFHLAWSQQGAGFRSDMRLTNEDWRQEALQVCVPFHCLHGTHNLTVSGQAVRELAAEMPHGRFRAIEDGGHSLPLSHTAFILRHVLAAAHKAGLGFDTLDH
ncbi:alpha/beta fold hydrolase [Ancylobacter vacuolatus]|uniref:Pimeloyl-ACP methyl ester carboxylesterase/DNA-binding CsgD family transcriptional regulator n=1 Tax=Ancylobacter vacuolatus TaxID=223389 RepID=A0ABU0DMT4_9HYPH|nr:alpha/beta fold hydrolase [Ancylobacter vacuolatus]MDQ0349616.1 pimeloyl-ACP methyl ester carboxylesterase/DNA-binding CsgD family transcriptional regulator [Ancylobacter vacuolatus]